MPARPDHAYSAFLCVLRVLCVRKAVTTVIGCGNVRPMSAKTEPSDRCGLPIAPGPVDDKDPATWSPHALAALQAVLDRSRASAGPALLDTFDRAERRMTAREFAAFWNASRMKAMATTGRTGAPHIAPVHAEFVAGRLRTTIYEHALRRRDIQTNPRVALTTWGPHGAAAIVYGRAREIPDSLRETRPGASGRARRTIALDIEVTRIYALGARDQEPAVGP